MKALRAYFMYVYSNWYFLPSSFALPLKENREFPEFFFLAQHTRQSWLQLLERCCCATRIFNEILVFVIRDLTGAVCNDSASNDTSYMECDHQSLLLSSNFIREAFRLTLIKRIRQNGKEIGAEGKLNAFLKTVVMTKQYNGQTTDNNEKRTQQKINVEY